MGAEAVVFPCETLESFVMWMILYMLAPLIAEMFIQLLIHNCTYPQSHSLFKFTLRLAVLMCFVAYLVFGMIRRGMEEFREETLQEHCDNANHLVDPKMLRMVFLLVGVMSFPMLLILAVQRGHQAEDAVTVSVPIPNPAALFSAPPQRSPLEDYDAWKRAQEDLEDSPRSTDGPLQKKVSVALPPVELAEPWSPPHTPDGSPPHLPSPWSDDVVGA
eukprot:gnl/TRDRNA2_/TRDRNA2_209109_c0_seq1.p1 gnl/TRDRNA2_/TRDRNA2_209109_c0~~gnl/TRDRNA2_/TRDRNA2_209109_c0_seq1.p1  ORF type:complete len:217 (-),score=16.08 gnl/TRDRNA2_/TRDRNA2_209109_c0_seq1:224-874(-)